MSAFGSFRAKTNRLRKKLTAKPDFVALAAAGAVFCCLNATGAAAGHGVSVEENAGRLQLDRPPEMREVDYNPADRTETSVNPPAFIWLPHKNVERWILEYGRCPDFSRDFTFRETDIETTIYIPSEELKPGQWYWRYGCESGSEQFFSRPRAFTITDDAAAFPFPDIDDLLAGIPATRPRAYFSPENVEKIRGNPDKYDWLVGPAVREAEAEIEKERPLFPEPKSWDEYGDRWREEYNDAWRAMRPYTRGMQNCALAYIYTGEERFAAEAKRRLMHFMTWDVDGPSSVYWPTELGMDIAQHAPLTFDWIYDALTEEEREKCLEVLGRRIRQINEMHRGMNYESRPAGSHPGRMIGFAVEGSLVLAHEIDDASEWLEYTLRVLWSVYPNWGGDDGGWNEGVSYWRYYMGRMVRTLLLLDSFNVPLKNKPFFRNTGDFGLYAAYPRRPARSFGDGYRHAVGRFEGRLMYQLATLYGNPYYRWHAEETGGDQAGGVAAFLSWRPEMESRSPGDLPQSRSFPSVGWTAMHSSMASPGENVLILFKSSPLGAISHAHADQNAFVIEAYTEPLAISSGYYISYGSPHHREWVWQTRAHNAILVDWEGQKTRSPESRGRIVEHIEAGGWAYSLGDAVEAYDGRLSRAYRHVFFLRPDVIIIVDDLSASEGEKSTYQWLLHARKEMSLNESEGSVLVKHGVARMAVSFLKPGNLAFEQKTGWDPAPVRNMPDQFHFTASTIAPSESARFITVLFPHRKGYGQTMPEVFVLEAEGGVALQVNGKTVVIKDPYSDEVRAAGRSTRRAAMVFERD